MAARGGGGGVGCETEAERMEEPATGINSSPKCCMLRYLLGAMKMPSEPRGHLQTAKAWGGGGRGAAEEPRRCLAKANGKDRLLWLHGGRALGELLSLPGSTRRYWSGLALEQDN